MQVNILDVLAYWRVMEKNLQLLIHLLAVIFFEIRYIDYRKKFNLRSLMD
jgi:hypothetical protein